MSFGSKSLPPPTAEQKRRWELIRAKGCICCYATNGVWNTPEIHHLLRGGLRLGHDHTVGLCEWHHRAEVRHQMLGTAEMTDLRGPSLACGSKPFHAEYGSNDALLRYQNELIGWTKPPQRERSRKRRATVCPTKRVPRRAGGFSP